MIPEANRSVFLVSRFAGCWNMDSRNSSDTDGNSLESASAKDAETLAGQSIFDEPDFLASVVLGFSEEASELKNADGVEPEATSDLERQRLLRQASEISKRLKHQQQELDRREANLQAATAALQGEQRAWRLQVSQEREDLAEDRKVLAGDEAMLRLKAKEIAAWEAAVTDDVNTRQKDLDSRDDKVSRQREKLADQHRSLHHQQHQLEESQAKWARVVAAHEQEHRAQLQEVSADRRALNAEKDQWSVEQENWNQLKSRIELFFQNQQTSMQARGRGEAERSVEVASSKVQADAAEEAVQTTAAMAAKVHRHGLAFEQELVRMRGSLKKWFMENLKPLEQQALGVISAEEASRKVPQLCRQIRGLIETAETTLDALRAENQACLSQIECRLQELSKEERGIIQSVRTQLDQLRGQWLQLDAAHALAAPHFMSRSTDRKSPAETQEVSDHRSPS